MERATVMLGTVKCAREIADEYGQTAERLLRESHERVQSVQSDCRTRIRSGCVFIDRERGVSGLASASSVRSEHQSAGVFAAKLKAPRDRPRPSNPPLSCGASDHGKSAPNRSIFVWKWDIKPLFQDEVLRLPSRSAPGIVLAIS